MKRFIPLAVAFIFLAFTSFCSADLIPNLSSCADDQDGVLTCTGVFGDKIEGEFPLLIDGVHHDYNFVTEQSELAGHVVGNFITDGYDPILRVTNYIDNDTDFAWTDYHVKVSMGIPFSVNAVTVANENWTTVPVAPPAFNATEVTPGKYVATFDYYAGTPVGIGETFEFGYKLQFNGSAIGYCVEMTPTPEPASLVLLLTGLAIGGFVWMRRR
jgi:hypothetical protein